MILFLNIVQYLKFFYLSKSLIYLQIFEDNWSRTFLHLISGGSEEKFHHPINWLIVNYTEIFRGVKSLKDGLHCFPWLWQLFSFLLYFLQAPAFAFLHDEKTVGLERYFSISRWFSPTGSHLSAGLGLHGQALDHLPRHREVLHLHSLHWHTPGITGSQKGFHHSFSYFLPDTRSGWIGSFY